MRLVGKEGDDPLRGSKMTGVGVKYDVILSKMTAVSLRKRSLGGKSPK